MSDSLISQFFGVRAEEVKKLIIEVMLRRHELASLSQSVSESQQLSVYGALWADYHRDLVTQGEECGFDVVDVGFGLCPQYRKMLEVNGVLLFGRRSPLDGNQFLTQPTASALLGLLRRPEAMFEYGDEPREDFYTLDSPAEDEAQESSRKIVIATIYADDRRAGRISWSLLQYGVDGVSPVITGEEVIWRPEDEGPKRFNSGSAFSEGALQDLALEVRKSRESTADE